MSQPTPDPTRWLTELMSTEHVMWPDLHIADTAKAMTAAAAPWTKAVAEITGFYANYDSMRYVGDVLVLRLRTAPTDAELDDLNARFGHLCASGRIERTTPLAEEVADGDKLELPRVRLHFAKRYYGQLRSLIDSLNALAPANADV